MSENNNKSFINFAGLNYYDIKYNFINFLKNQSEFSDYNFEGSNLNILLDILSYNTSQQGYYNTMVANEMFIDRANKRSSVVSLAKLLGYTPSTKRAAKASVLVIVDSDNLPVSGSIEKGSIFSGTGNDGTYSFTNTQTYGFYPYTFNANGDALSYAAGPIIIHQGVLNTTSYNVQAYDQPFLIRDENADKDSIRVYVLNSVSDPTGINIPWFSNKDFISLNGESKVFFTEENSIGQLTLKFGDGIIGKKLEIGNVVIIEYLSTSGSNGNNIGVNDTLTRSSFSYDGDNNFTVITVESSNNGSDKESSFSIKRNAIRNYTSKERAVTLTDYEGIVLGNYNDNVAVRCWGGEDNDPPFYGRVFVSVRPIGSTILSRDEKRNLANNILKQKNIVGVDVVVVDPEILYVNSNIKVFYDKTLTNESEVALTKKIKDSLTSYFRQSLIEFGDSVFSNDVENQVKNASNAFKSVESNFTLEKRILPEINITERIIIDFQNELYHPYDGHKSILTTSTFKINSSSGENFIEDDGYGKLILKNKINDVITTINSNYGTIDYKTGKLIINAIKVFSITNNNSFIKFVVQLNSNNIFSKRNNILQFDSLDPNANIINLVQVKTQRVTGGSGSVIARPNNY